MTFEFPLPPNLANGRTHWAVKNKARKRYVADCDTLQSAKLLPAPPAEALPSVELRSVLFVGQRMDDDNAMARIKWAVDWLKTRGYIVDDRRPHCQMRVPGQIVDRKRPRLVIHLESL